MANGGISSAGQLRNFAVGVPQIDIAGGLQTGMQRVEQLQQAPLRKEAAELQVQQARENLQRTQGQILDEQTKRELTSIATGAAQIQPLLSAGNVQAAKQMLQARLGVIQARGGNPADTQLVLNLLNQGKLEEAKQQVQGAVDLGIRTGVLQGLPGEGGKTGLASAKTEILADGTVVQSLPTGQVQVIDPSGQIVTGQARLDALDRAQEFALSQKQREADIAVGETRSKKAAELKAKRTSTIREELSTRNRNAARESVRLNQALNLVEKADQGITGSLKLQLARLLPGIDVENEAVLDQTLKSLAVEQLQNFKGPTTDFEFGVVESTTGAIGDPRSANRARLNSLKRNNWFNRREFEQFNRHIKAGGDPDDFRFNFGETIKTKKGEFTLKDLQDTAVDGNKTIEEVLRRLNK